MRMPPSEDWGQFCIFVADIVDFGTEIGLINEVYCRRIFGVRARVFAVYL